MRCVIQRVKNAEVRINGYKYSSIEKGLLVFLAVEKDDLLEDSLKTAKKISQMRIFSNSEGKFYYSIKDIKGEILLVPQFTLYGDTSKGRRPDFARAASHKKAQELYEETAKALGREGLVVKTGVFAAEMLVKLENDGPVTVIYETKQR